MTLNRIKKANDFLKAFSSGASISDLIKIIKSDEFQFPPFEEIRMVQSIKHLYGNESLVLKFGWLPVLRIAGVNGIYRIMTPTTGEVERVEKSTLNELLESSELFGELLNVNLLRLEDYKQRPFNVFGEFRMSPYENEQQLKEFAWVFSVLFFNQEIFNQLLHFPIAHINTLKKSIDLHEANEPWKNEMYRDTDSAQKELQDLYQSLSYGEGDVYLMDGCWLTPSGEIVER